MKSKSLSVSDVEEFRDRSDIGILTDVVSALYGDGSDGMAEKLVERFGSVASVFRATKSELMSVPGMTERVASFFSELKSIGRQAMLRDAQCVTFHNENTVVKYVSAYGMDGDGVFDLCIYTDAKNRFISAERLSGEDRFREIVNGACRNDADKLIIARYIPHGIDEPLAPSRVRLKTLVKLINILELIDIEFVDYVALSFNMFYSLRRALSGEEETVHVDRAETDGYVELKNAAHAADDYYEKLTGERVLAKNVGSPRKSSKT